jgi:hypothetical protein
MAVQFVSVVRAKGWHPAANVKIFPVNDGVDGHLMSQS